MTINLVSLFTAFLDHSKQEETGQITKFDRFTEGPVNLAENGIDIVMFSIPKIPRNIGVFYAMQRTGTGDKKDDYPLELGTCSAEKIQ